MRSGDAAGEGSRGGRASLQARKISAERPAMKALLSRIVAGLRTGLYPNEKAVSTSIVVPILRQLGWDDSNSSEVRPEHQTGRGRVDFALFGSPRQPGVFVEVKAVGRAAAADVQLFEYAFHEGAQLAVLTDGRVWSVYVPGQPGSFEDRKVHQLDLLERTVDDAEARLVRDLAKDRVTSGAALQDALSDYRSNASQRIAAETIPRAWAELLRERDILFKLLRDRTEALCGHVPGEAALEAFVATLNGGQPVPPPLPQPPAPPPSPPPPGAGRLGWRVLDRQASARTQNEALAGFLNELFRRFPGKVEQIIAAVGTRTRAHIADAPERIYPKRPDLGVKGHVRLATGHVLGTHVSREEKLKIARRAAAASGLAWGEAASLEI